MTNEASTVDGGIPLQLHSKRAWPAATDPRCWVPRTADENVF